MNNGKTFFAFVLGATVGSLIAWRLTKDKYDRILEDIYNDLQEEVEELEDPDETFEDDDEAEESDEVKEYKKVVKETGYAATFEQPDQDEDEATDEDEEEATDEVDEEEGDEYVLGPRVISPEEFDDCDYPVVELTYYADGFLTDEDDEIVSDINDVIGKDSLNHFGDYNEDPDVVYVRDDEARVLYEICRDNRKYMNVRAESIGDTEE